MVVCRSLIILLSFFYFGHCFAYCLWYTASGYFFCVVWLPLWYLMILPLVPYDSPFGTFWLPLWYLLITLWYLLLTHLVHCAYLFGIFWLPLWYLLPTPLVSSDHPLVPTAYPFGSFSLPLYFLRDTPFFLPTLLLPSFCYFGTFWLSFSLVPSAFLLLSSDYLFGTFWLPPLVPSGYSLCYRLPTR